MRTRWFISLGIAIVVVVAAVVLITADGEREPQPAQAATQERGPQHWERLVAKGRQEADATILGPWPFAEVKQRPGGMPSALRREAVEVLGEPAPLDLRFADARYATTPSKLELWVVPGTGVTCMFRAVKMVSSCTTTAQAYRHGIILQVYKPDKDRGQPIEFTSLGIVPDSVRRVPAKIGERWVTISVVANTFFVKSRKPIGIPRMLKRPPQ